MSELLGALAGVSLLFGVLVGVAMICWGVSLLFDLTD